MSALDSSLISPSIGPPVMDIRFIISRQSNALFTFLFILFDVSYFPERPMPSYVCVIRKASQQSIN